MEDWARHQFKLSKKASGEITLREQLEQVEKQIGRKPQELIPPCEFPKLLARVWSAFLALSQTRPVGFSGAGNITYSEIKAWMELTGNRLSTRDVELLTRIDNLYLEVHREKNG